MTDLLLAFSIIVNIILLIKISQKRKEKLRNDIIEILNETKFKNHIAIFLLEKYNSSLKLPFDVDVDTLKDANESINTFKAKINQMDVDKIDFENVKVVKQKEQFTDSIIANIIDYK